MHSDNVNLALYEISNAVNTTDDLDELYHKIHLSLKGIIDVTNFYIAIYDPKEDLLHFPYWIDEFTTSRIANKYHLDERRDSITALVIKAGKPLIFRKNQLIEYWKKQKCNYQEPICEIWLGVPLIVNREVIGVITLQHYTDPNRYDDSDVSLLNSISEQIAIAIDRKQSQTRYRNLVENIKDIVYTTNSAGRIIYISPSATGITGYRPEELRRIYRWCSNSTREQEVNSFIHSEDLPEVSSLIECSVGRMTPFETEYRVMTGDGDSKWVLERGQFFYDDMGNSYLEGVITDIQERKRAELLNRVLYNISNAVNTAFDLYELYERIHKALEPIINVQHFYIALYDRSNDIIRFTFDTDSVDLIHPEEILNASNSTSLTAKVIRAGKPLIFSKEEQLKFAEKQGGPVIGIPSESWLGAPLIVRDEVFGAMVSQVYSGSKPYTEEDIRVYNSVSGQIALGIERKQAEEQIQFREMLITTLHKISNAMHSTANLYQLYESIHHALSSVMNVDNFTIVLYDWIDDTLRFYYSADQVDPTITQPIEKASESNSLTYQVFKAGKTLLLRENEKASFKKEIGGREIGKVSSKCWLGVPLVGRGKVLGVIINQSYSDPDCYSKRDIELLESISEQVAFAIEFKKAEADLVSAQTELLEKAHKAGMADIASDSIHNLGNILNSVKTSNDVIDNILRQSSISGLKKATDLLKQNMGSLDEFICNNPNGVTLMQYFITIREALNAEINQIKEQTLRLSGKIGLMTSVIRTQQNYIYEGTTIEEVAINEIVDNILNMYESILNQRGIAVFRDYDTISRIQVQKTKLIHIIMNLIDNAKDSMTNPSDTNQMLSVSLVQDTESVVLKIKDNGEGIVAENMDRVFSPGYTTKPHGKGLGLYNCVNLASEMKGSLRAESDGLGEGATFILELPK
ncbi:GAF domain-containing protein [bacterium]|nr:GAF domain-containing protein [bacterium]